MRVPDSLARGRGARCSARRCGRLYMVCWHKRYGDAAAIKDIVEIIQEFACAREGVPWGQARLPQIVIIIILVVVVVIVVGTGGQACCRVAGENFDNKSIIRKNRQQPSKIRQSCRQTFDSNKKKKHNIFLKIETDLLEKNKI